MFKIRGFEDPKPLWTCNKLSHQAVLDPETIVKTCGFHDVPLVRIIHFITSLQKLTTTFTSLLESNKNLRDLVFYTPVTAPKVSQLVFSPKSLWKLTFYRLHSGGNGADTMSWRVLLVGWRMNSLKKSHGLKVAACNEQLNGFSCKTFLGGIWWFVCSGVLLTPWICCCFRLFDMDTPKNYWLVIWFWDCFHEEPRVVPSVPPRVLEHLVDTGQSRNRTQQKTSGFTGQKWDQHDFGV